MTLALRSELVSLSSLDRALAAAACPHFGVDLDPVALLRDEWSIDESFSRLGAIIRHVRARDALRGDAHRTKPMPIGEGNVDWQRLLSNLDEAGFRGWMTLDPLELSNRAAAASAGLGFLQKIAAQ